MPRLTKIKLLLRQGWEEWDANTSTLRSKLRRANDLMEGVKEPKNFPWPGSSNLHVPLIEIHITICHSVVAATMLDMDPIWFVKALIEGLGELTAVVITIVQEATNLFPVLQYIFLPGRVPPRGSK